jgi:hypothetical protein
MIARNSPTKRDALWKRYWSIKDEHGCGLCEPILWHLALGGDFSAMVTLADTFPMVGMCGISDEHRAADSGRGSVGTAHGQFQHRFFGS